MVFGASPELCVVVLILPTLQDEEVLVVQGAQQMIYMTGYGREVHFSEMSELDQSNTVASKLSKERKRTVLFMNALELNSYDTSELTPGLLPVNVDRELRKAYAAFSSAQS